MDILLQIRSERSPFRYPPRHLVRPAGVNGFILARWANIVFFYPIGQQKVTLEPLLRSKNDENRACVPKILFELFSGYLIGFFLSRVDLRGIFNCSKFSFFAT